MGGIGADTFVFSDGAGLSGGIDGGGGADTLDYGGVSEAVDVVLAGSDADGFRGTATGLGAGFRGIDALLGGTFSNSLTGEDVDSTWRLDGSPTYDDGSATLGFSRFEAIHGGRRADTFLLIGDALGNLAATLDGGAGDDRFLFEQVASLTGTLEGGRGFDTLSYADFDITVAVRLTGSDADGYQGTEPTSFSPGEFRGIDQLIGSPADRGPDALSGEDAPPPGPSTRSRPTTTARPSTWYSPRSRASRAARGRISSTSGPIPPRTWRGAAGMMSSASRRTG